VLECPILGFSAAQAVLSLEVAERTCPCQPFPHREIGPRDGGEGCGIFFFFFVSEDRWHQLLQISCIAILSGIRSYFHDVEAISTTVRRVAVLDDGIMAIAQSPLAFVNASLFRCVATEQFLF